LSTYNALIDNVEEFSWENYAAHYSLKAQPIATFQRVDGPDQNRVNVALDIFVMCSLRGPAGNTCCHSLALRRPHCKFLFAAPPTFPKRQISALTKKENQRKSKENDLGK